MSERDVTTVRGAYAAFARQDIPAVLATFDPGIDWHCPDELPYGGRFHGPEEVVGYFQALAGAFDSLQVLVDQVLAAGQDHVVVEGRDRFVIAGEPVDVAFLHLVTMREGKVAGFREYTDTGALLQRLDSAVTS
ncbi:MAG: nuclear transport factor 2 family protein [Pseudonocardia sp.]|nr:nuclear transport factor 2 family protein [Pseudonocardia sp.]